MPRTFISSTIDDLEDFRKEAALAAAAQGFVAHRSEEWLPGTRQPPLVIPFFVQSDGWRAERWEHHEHSARAMSLGPSQGLPHEEVKRRLGL